MSANDETVKNLETSKVIYFPNTEILMILKNNGMDSQQQQRALTELRVLFEQEKQVVIPEKR